MGLNVCLDVKIDILCGMSNLIDESKFFVTDYNFSVFIPMRRWGTLAFNLYH